eukprot:scaffold30644_cov67-Phaeocystis_antarctica.AAC.7
MRSRWTRYSGTSPLTRPAGSVLGPSPLARVVCVASQRQRRPWLSADKSRDWARRRAAPRGRPRQSSTGDGTRDFQR